VRVVEFTPELAEPISLFESVASSSVAVGNGSGEMHVYAVHFKANAQIGMHPTGFCQLFLVVQGSGWAAGEDGQRINLSAGQGVFFERGEMHSKGSETGMVAIMVQATRIDPMAAALAKRGNSAGAA
jgi:quercetin dioxygenase-like cupin family protein